MRIKVAFLGSLLLLFFIQFGESFKLRSYKWPNATYDYYVNPNNNDVGINPTISGIKFGSNVWKTWCRGVFKGKTQTNEVSKDGMNTVFFRNQASGNKIAQTFVFKSADGKTILEFDIVFYDAANRFFGGSTGCNNGFYIADVAAFEFGHVIGIGNSGISEATMNLANASRVCSTAARSLATDDQNAAAKRYGAAPSGLDLKCEPRRPVSGAPPLTVDFSVIAEGGSSPYRYFWTFGDGSTSAGRTPTHRYNNVGNYFPSVEVSSEDGQSGNCSTASIQVTGQSDNPDIDGPSSISLNDNTDKTAQIGNEGNAALKIDSVGLIIVNGSGEALYISDDSCSNKSINAGGACGVTLTCCPSCAGQTAGATGILRIRSNDPDEDPFDINVTCNAP